jgi:cytoskeletal protein CcmA (bactofilin family)
MITDQEFKNFHYNILGVNSRINGNLVLTGDVIVNSHIEGSIEIFGEGKLILERESFVKGKIKAIDIDIFGSFEGDIDCSGLVSIRSGAEVVGTITSAQLVIYPGAVVDMKADSEKNNS